MAREPGAAWGLRSDVVSTLRNNPAYWRLKRTIKESVLYDAAQDESTDVDHATVVALVRSALARDVALLANAVQRAAERTTTSSSVASLALPDDIVRRVEGGAAAVARPGEAPLREPLEFLRRQQLAWTRKLVKRMDKIAATAPGLKMARPRSAAQRGLKWVTLLDTITARPLDAGAFLYDAVDLLREVAHAEDPTYKAAGLGMMFGAGTTESSGGGSAAGVGANDARAWGLIKIAFHVPTLVELRGRFPAFELRRRHLGVESDAGLILRRDAEATEVLAHGVARDARRYLQQGCPNHARPRMWELALDAGADVDGRSRAWLNHLRGRVAGSDLFVDHLIAADVARLANSDDSYFVFEDVIKEVLLLLSRDTRVWRHKTCAAEPCLGKPPSSRPGPSLLYPPSGVLPFRGMAHLIAPLAFVFSDPDRAYRVAFAMYTRHFCQLHTVSSAPEGLLRLCAVFERLLQSEGPELLDHLLMIGVEPLAVALPWMMTAFAGVLPPDQTLLLWDRIIGCDTLLLLPILSVAIFRFRRSRLLRARTARQAEKVLLDCVELNAAALLQFALFGGPLVASAQTENPPS